MKRAFWPTSRLGWWAFGLGVASLAWSVMSPLLRELLGMALAAATLHPLLIPMAYTVAIIDLALAFAALLLGIVALARGERSWMALVAFVPLTMRLVLAILSALELGFASRSR